MRNNRGFNEHLSRAQDRFDIDAKVAISRLMEETGITRSELALRMNVSKSFITNTLNGNIGCHMTMNTYAAMCFALGAKPKVSYEKD